jgi:hypothetical protein
MVRSPAAPLVSLGVAVAIASSIGCGSNAATSQFGPHTGGSGGSSRTASSSSTAGFGTGTSVAFAVGPLAPDASVPTPPPRVPCDGGGTCTCTSGASATITGHVYDPSGENPLYNVSVYIPDPRSPLPDLATVPLSCGCGPLYPASVLAIAATDAYGRFEFPCAPSGTVSLVVQTGKWRREYDGISIAPNQVNDVARLRLPADASEGSLPDIAIATGGADSLECLPLRIGVSASEYVLGAAAGGHVHIYTGYHGATTEQGSIAASDGLWDSQGDLNQHDVVLLSCEGHETTGGTPGVPMNSTFQTYLMNYANAGGRVFASHFHYAWFNGGPFSIASWITGTQQLDDSLTFPAVIDTALDGGAPFPEGTALAEWLGGVGALTAGQLPIWFTRHNVEALVQPPSTEWIHLDPGVTQAPSAVQYFSVDTPIGGAPGAVCGRIVYSDLHVSGGPGTNAPGIAPDYPTAAGSGRGGGQGGVVPTECAHRTLTPQELALEFMLFDLSSCLVPIGQSAPPMPPVVPVVPR